MCEGLETRKSMVSEHVKELQGGQGMGGERPGVGGQTGGTSRVKSPATQ